MTSSRLRELSRLASPAPWEHAIDPVRGPTYEIWADFANRIGCHIGTPDAALIVALRNDAEKYADLRDAVKAYKDATDKREAFDAEYAEMWESDKPHHAHKVAALMTVETNAYRAMLAALAALGGEE